MNAEKLEQLLIRACTRIEVDEGLKIRLRQTILECCMRDDAVEIREPGLGQNLKKLFPERRMRPRLNVVQWL